MDPNCTGEVTRIRKGYDIENHGTIEIKGSLGIEHFLLFWMGRTLKNNLIRTNSLRGKVVVS